LGAAAARVFAFELAVRLLLGAFSSATTCASVSTVTVTSEPGKGSVFTVRLPCGTDTR
jgi:hypothetical protein